MPPIRHPSKILCVGLNYRAHSEETGMGAPDYPAIFARFPSTLVGHGQAIIKPGVSEQLDYEAELVAVIGKRCKGVSVAEALGFIAGYSIFNEASIRDYQMRTSQWTIGKNFDATGGFGPWMATPDEVPPGADGLRIQTRLNGKTMQDGNTGDMVFKVADLVSLLSQVMTLEPGDIIVTGTPAGVGFSRKPPVFMKPGDVCEIEIEALGTLRNPVAAG
ncbi:MAG: fumarylacetoacetate hydrolase family protein [Spirochaetales bacterium]|nr:fumarylacetoacetate hydrolase family protein [Spirochaetales bacterium]